MVKPCVQLTQKRDQLSLCVKKKNKHVHPLHPNISMYILHTVPYTFPKALSRRICLTIKSFFSF